MKYFEFARAQRLNRITLRANGILPHPDSKTGVPSPETLGGRDPPNARRTEAQHGQNFAHNHQPIRRIRPRMIVL